MCLVKEKNYKIVRQVFTLRQRNQEAFYTGLRKPKQMNKKNAMLKKKKLNMYKKETYYSSVI